MNTGKSFTLHREKISSIITPKPYLHNSQDFEVAAEDSIEASIAVASQVAQQASAVGSIIESQVKHDENKQPNTGTLEAEATSIESKQSPRAPIIPVLKIRLVIKDVFFQV